MIYYLTEGEYSDFCILGICEGPDGLDMDGLRKAYKVEFPGHFWKEWIDDKYLGHFTEWMITTAGMKSIEAKELHIDG